MSTLPMLVESKIIVLYAFQAESGVARRMLADTEKKELVSIWGDCGYSDLLFHSQFIVFTAFSGDCQPHVSYHRPNPSDKSVQRITGVWLPRP